MNRRKPAEGKAREQQHNRLKKFQRRMRNQNPGACRIPQKPGEPDETNILQGCHIISRGAYLRHIAENHHVMHWWFDPKRILESLQRSEWVAIETLEPSYIPIKNCTTRYACNWHDHKLFEVIDAGHLDATRFEHLFLLGFRAMAGSLAAWQAAISFVEQAQQGENESTGRLIDQAKSSLSRAEAIFDQWRTTYLQNDYEQICAYRVRAKCSLRCAGTSIVDIGNNDLGTLTLLPQVCNGKLTGSYDIIVVSLRKSWRNPIGRLLQMGTLKRTAAMLKVMMETNPGDALEWMAANMNHVAVNPADYQNEDLISLSQRTRIEQAAASQINSRLNKILNSTRH